VEVHHGHGRAPFLGGVTLRCVTASSKISVKGSLVDELLAATDVIRCSGDRRVRHEVDGVRGDVGRSYDPPDRKR
jgi:hypothetical protein